MLLSLLAVAATEISGSTITAIIAALGGTAGIVAIIKAIKDRPATPDTLELKQNIKEIREECGSLKVKVTELTESQRTFNLLYLRQAINTIYYNHCKDNSITETEYEIVLGLYDVYKSLGGNGITEQHIYEIKQWRRQ